MRRVLTAALGFLVCFAALLCAAAPVAPRQLQIYFIDVEGGQATLVVTPAKQSLLIDTGWPGFDAF